MATVFADMSISLDGFTTGPDDGVEEPMGIGGERLHEWLFAGDISAESDSLIRAMDRAGAVVIGRRMYDHGQIPWGGESPFRGPAFVLTHHPPQSAPRGITFVSTGVEDAIVQALKVADGEDVCVAGANIIQQALRAGLVDEIQLHIVPVIIGGGRWLFENAVNGELEITKTIDSPQATHIRYRIEK